MTVNAPDAAAADRARRASIRAPAIRPTGRKIVFESDRGGTQQLYVMNADGSINAAHQLRRGTLRDPGLVAARRPHRLHQAWAAAVSALA
jgi:hypothetical protein